MESNTTNSTEAPLSLHETIKAAGIEYGTWQSDLYIPVTDATCAILANFPLQRSNTTKFVHAIHNKLWFDIPFANDDFKNYVSRQLITLMEVPKDWGAVEA